MSERPHPDEQPHDPAESVELPVEEEVSQSDKKSAEANPLAELGYELKPVTSEQAISAVEAIIAQRGTPTEATAAILALFGIPREQHFLSQNDERIAYDRYGSDYVILRDSDGSPILRGPNVRNLGWNPVQYRLQTAWQREPGFLRSEIVAIVRDLNAAVESFNQRF